MSKISLPGIILAPITALLFATASLAGNNAQSNMSNDGSFEISCNQHGCDCKDKKCDEKDCKNKDKKCDCSHECKCDNVKDDDKHDHHSKVESSNNLSESDNNKRSFA